MISEQPGLRWKLGSVTWARGPSECWSSSSLSGAPRCSRKECSVSHMGNLLSTYCATLTAEHSSCSGLTFWWWGQQKSHQVVTSPVGKITDKVMLQACVGGGAQLPWKTLSKTGFHPRTLIRGFMSLPKIITLLYCCLPIFMTTLFFFISEENICHLTWKRIAYIRLPSEHFQAKRNFSRLKLVQKFPKERNTVSWGKRYARNEIFTYQQIPVIITFVSTYCVARVMAWDGEALLLGRCVKYKCLTQCWREIHRSR